jgi:hypothetical protein
MPPKRGGQSQPRCQFKNRGIPRHFAPHPLTPLTSVSQAPQSSVKKPAQPAHPGRRGAKPAGGGAVFRRVRARLFALLLGLLGPARLAIFLYRGFGKVFVFGADHSENRSCPIAATRNGTKLNRPFAALANDDTTAKYGARTAVERAQRRFTRARDNFLFDHRRQLVDELLNDFLKIGPSGHHVPPVCGGE